MGGLALPETHPIWEGQGGLALPETHPIWEGQGGLALPETHPTECYYAPIIYHRTRKPARGSARLA
jgi:hypothetical protein